MIPLFGKELFIRFTTRGFLERLSILCVSFFPCCFNGGMWHLSVLLPGHVYPFIFHQSCIVYVLQTLDTEDLTRVIISYEIYKTNLRRGSPISYKKNRV